MTPIRRLDHVAVVVRDTEAALETYRDRLGLRVAHTEVLQSLRVRLTYLDCGNAFLQLVEPLDSETSIGRWLDEHGEGLHHVAFGVENSLAAASALATDGAPPPTEGQGRGRVSAFVPGEPEHGVRLECTDFVYEDDVIRSPGWLAPSPDEAVASDGTGR
jgi:methylmalonyl-CoA/ethylmalonyl-CoA epimerase